MSVILLIPSDLEITTFRPDHYNTFKYSSSWSGYLSNLSTGNPLMTLFNSRLMKLITGKKAGRADRVRVK